MHSLNTTHTNMQNNFKVKEQDFHKYRKFIRTLRTVRYNSKPITINGYVHISITLDMEDYNRLGEFSNSIEYKPFSRKNLFTRKLFRTVTKLLNFKSK